jgi:hypothetical protein
MYVSEDNRVRGILRLESLMERNIYSSSSLPDTVRCGAGQL